MNWCDLYYWLCVLTGFNWISWTALDYFQGIWNKVKHFFPPSNLSSAYHLKLPTVTEFKYLTKRKRAFSGRAPKQSSHSNCLHRNVAPHSRTVEQRAAVSAALFRPQCRAAPRLIESNGQQNWFGFMRFQSPYLPSDICILSGRKFCRNYFISTARSKLQKPKKAAIEVFKNTSMTL